ncbi:MAG: hypothetical protein Kow0049_24910 [Stanieria sp.]
MLAIGSSSGGDSGNSQQDWTTMVMQQPFGRCLVGLAGAIIVGLGFALIYQAYKEKFRKKLNMSKLNGQQKNWLVKISRFGIAARGVVFIIIGFFVLQAAYKSNSNQVRGLDGALLSLSQQPFGKFLLALVAAGLVAYGIYLFVQARYRRFKFSG